MKLHYPEFVEEYKKVLSERSFEDIDELEIIFGLLGNFPIHRERDGNNYLDEWIKEDWIMEDLFLVNRALKVKRIKK
jgi:hypothetical protein